MYFVRFKPSWDNTLFFLSPLGNPLTPSIVFFSLSMKKIPMGDNITFKDANIGIDRVKLDDVTIDTNLSEVIIRFKKGTGVYKMTVTPVIPL